MLLTFLLTLTLVEEHFTPIQPTELKPMRELLHLIPNVKLIYAMFVTTLIVQASVMSIDPSFPVCAGHDWQPPQFSLNCRNCGRPGAGQSLIRL